MLYAISDGQISNDKSQMLYTNRFKSLSHISSQISSHPIILYFLVQILNEVANRQISECCRHIKVPEFLNIEWQKKYNSVSGSAESWLSVTTSRNHHHHHHHHHHRHHHHFRLLDGMTERKPIHVDKQYKGNKMTSANNSYCTSVFVLLCMFWVH